MATAPVKPPLHNFPLSFLKWGSKNHTNTNHRYRRPVSAEPEPTASDDHNDSEPDRPHHTNRVGSRTARHRFSLTSCSEKLPKLPQQQNSERESEDSEGDGKAATAGAEEAEVQKPWNLRPRRAPASAAMTFKANNTGANCELHEPEGPNPKQSEQPAPKSMRLRGLAEGPSMEKKEKRKFWIALSKDEIEEDIFVMTGSRPARRPKKRPKNVQKQLDNVFPGLWLVGFSADAYRGADSPTKK